MTVIEKVARALQAHDPANIGHKTGYALARTAVEAMRVSDADVMAHPWLCSDHQDTINAYIEGILATEPPR